MTRNTIFGVDIALHIFQIVARISKWSSPQGNFIGISANPLGTFKVPHKCSHTTGQISFHFKLGHQKRLGVDGECP